MQIVTAVNFDKEVKESDTPVLVDFWADWCMPCKKIAEALGEIDAELGDKLKIVKVNVDEQIRLTVDHEIRSIPTLILYKDGVEVSRLTGAKPRSEILEVVEPFISL